MVTLLLPVLLSMLLRLDFCEFLAKFLGELLELMVERVRLFELAYFDRLLELRLSVEKRERRLVWLDISRSCFCWIIGQKNGE